jgi:hypothetical protein
LVNRFFFLLLLFSLARLFPLAQFFVSWQQFYYDFSFGPPLTRSFFLGSSYLPSKPKPTFLPHPHPSPFALTSIARALGVLLVVKSFNVVAARAQKQEELGAL